MSKYGSGSKPGRFLNEYYTDPNRDEDSLTGKFFDLPLFKRLLAYVLPFKKYLILSFVCLILARAAHLVYPLVFKIAVDDYIGAEGMAVSDKLIGVYFCAAIVLLTFLVNGFAQFGETVFSAILAQKSMHNLRLTVFRHILDHSMKFFGQQPVGRLLTRTTNDVSTLNDMIATSLLTLIGNILILAGSLVGMFYISWKLTLISFAVMPLILIATAIFRKKVRDSYRLIRWLSAKMNAFFAEMLSGMRVIQLFRREKRVYDTFVDLNHDTRLANIHQMLLSSVYMPTIEALSSTIKALLLYVGAMLVVDSPMKLGALVAFFMFFDRAIDPIRNLAEQYNVFQGAMASSERIFRVLDTPHEIVDPPQPKMPEKCEGEVRFENVYFAYNDDKWVLRDLDLTIKPGESVALVGATGAGKSSIINALCRFYEIGKGSIKLDGVDIREMSMDHLNKYIVVVPQDVFLFSDSIENNIKLWSDDISREQAIASACYVNADPFIRRLPQGYDTVLRERAAGLSVGQKQLLSFARALAHDPKILVLDEATSSIDPETEDLIQDALRKLLRGRTSIVIAHRLSTVRHCDRIVVMHKGKIREVGKHEELLALDGIYKKLYELQYKTQQLNAS